jgi:hypothetical protein
VARRELVAQRDGIEPDDLGRARLLDPSARVANGGRYDEQPQSPTTRRRP